MRHHSSLTTKPLLFALLSVPSAATLLLHGADRLSSRRTYAEADGETKTRVAVDAAGGLPRYPAVEPKHALSTWKLKPGVKPQLAAHEPQVRDPIAICFDEK